MSIKNPYAFHKLAHPEAPAKQMIAITPTDDTALVKVVKALRIFNSGSAAASLTFRGEDNQPITISCPPGLSREDTFVHQVDATGTDVADLEIHGYTD